MTKKEDKILEILDKIWIQKQIAIPASMIMDGCSDEDLKPLVNGGYVYCYGDVNYSYAIGYAGVEYVTGMELNNYNDVIKIINEKTYESKVQKLNEPYWNRSYKTRWQYMLPVIKILKNEKFRSILEIGAYKINYTNISHNMDLEEDFIDPDNKGNTQYIQDAGDTPYEIPDKYYDMVLACQTFEHFEGKQPQAFQEIKRIANQAIITIPWHWNCPSDKNHHNINETHCIKWFGDDYKDYVVKDEIKVNRRLLHFKF